MADLHLTIPEAVGRMRDDDERAADEVVDALRWMLGDLPLHRLHQAALQQFLWFELPYKWLGGPDRHRGVAAALGRFFALTGMDRYATICADPFTAAQVERFAAGDVERGYLAFLATNDATAIVPPDTEVLVWGDRMGPIEFDAFWHVAMALEMAVAAGELVPGRRGWREARAATASAALRHPRPEHFGSSLSEDVDAERIERWAAGDHAAQARTQILAPVVNRLLAPVPVPRTAGRALDGLDWICRRAAAGGAPLTASGALAHRVVLDAVGAVPHRFAGPAHGKVRREADVPGLTAAHALARRSGLVRPAGRVLRSTARGATAASGGSGIRWRAVTAGFVPTRGLDAEVWPLALAQVLASGTVVPAAMVRPTGVALTEMGVTGRRGAPRAEGEVVGSLHRLSVLLGASGATPGGAGRRRGAPGLTVTGEALVRAVLRGLATRPA